VPNKLIRKIVFEHVLKTRLNHVENIGVGLVVLVIRWGKRPRFVVLAVLLPVAKKAGNSNH
jgi:hypothetical protein